MPELTRVTEQHKKTMEQEIAQKKRKLQWEKAKNKLEIEIAGQAIIRVLIWALYIAATIQLFWPNLKLVGALNIIGIAVLGIVTYRMERRMRQEFNRNHPKP